jgi:hypothetical protein
MGKITVYKSNGSLLGYFRQVQLDRFGKNEYAIKGIFYTADGTVPEKVNFNPQSCPYSGIAEEIAEAAHKQLTNIYIQRGRQPVIMTALGTDN